MQNPRLSCLLVLSLLTPLAQAKLTFEKDVRPIIKAHCTHCHGEEEKPEGGVDLRLRRFMDDIVMPGKPAESKLVEVIRSGEMPEKGKKLTEAQMHVIEQWITDGATTAKPEPLTLAPGTIISDEDRQFWAFQPIKRPAVPSDVPANNVRTPVDAFVLSKLKAQGLSFAEAADRRALIRRVTLDLTGLPPTPEEVEAFLADSAAVEDNQTGRQSDKESSKAAVSPSPHPIVSPSSTAPSSTPDPAYERLIDRLLASKSYGERWARHWLDVVGYADSNGYSEADSLRPHAWRFRDYVIRSINDDKPWSDFIQEQLAGDELAGATHADYQQAVLDPKRTDQLTATAFLRMAPDGTGDSNDDPKLAKNQVIAEQIKIMTSSLLGVTVACAQCHDHRYDPITQADYYRLRAIFDPAYHWEAWRAPAQRLYSLYTPAEKAKAAEIEAKAREIETAARAMSKKFLDEIFEVEILKLPEAERAPFREARATPKEKQTEARRPSSRSIPPPSPPTPGPLRQEETRHRGCQDGRGHQAPHHQARRGFCDGTHRGQRPSTRQQALQSWRSRSAQTSRHSRRAEHSSPSADRTAEARHRAHRLQWSPFGLRAVAYQRTASARCPRVGESLLDAAHGPGNRQHPRRLRSSG